MDIRAFLFGPYPLRLETADNIFFLISAAALIIGIILFLVLFFAKLSRIDANLLHRLKNWALTYGIVSLIWSGFRYETAAYLEWRFWFLLISLAYLIWLVKILIYLFIRYRKDKANLRDQAIKQKYLK